MKFYRVLGVVVVSGSLFSFSGFSQQPENSNPPNDQIQSEELPTPAPAAPEAAPSSPQSDAMETNYQNERASLLQTLQKEVEPNLIKGDLDKLNNSVKRLGSYRRDWMDQAESLLVTNAPVAELFIYRYTTVGNKRLNHAALETLLKFPSLRFPRAVLAFSKYLTLTPEDKSAYMDLLAKAVQQKPDLANEALQLATSSFGNLVAMEDKLYFASKICGGLAKDQSAKDLLMSWASGGTARPFWERVISAEVLSCFKGTT